MFEGAKRAFPSPPLGTGPAAGGRNAGGGRARDGRRVGPTADGDVGANVHTRCFTPGIFGNGGGTSAKKIFTLRASPPAHGKAARSIFLYYNFWWTLEGLE